MGAAGRVAGARATPAPPLSIGLYLVAPAARIGLFKPAGVPAVVLIAAGTVMLQTSAAWHLFDACALTRSEVLRAAGDTTWPMLARLGLAWAPHPGHELSATPPDAPATAPRSVGSSSPS